MATRRLRSTVRARSSATRLAREQAELAGAVTLVARGHARRVTVAGLRFGERLAPRAALMARAMGVRVSVGSDPADRQTVFITSEPD